MQRTDKRNSGSAPALSFWAESGHLKARFGLVPDILGALNEGLLLDRSARK